MKRSDFFKTFLGGVLASKVKEQVIPSKVPAGIAVLPGHVTSGYYNTSQYLRGDGEWVSLDDQYMKSKKAFDDLLVKGDYIEVKGTYWRKDEVL